MSKLCRSCETVKPLDQFSKNKSRIDGLSHACKKCSTLRLKKWYEKVKDTEEYKAACREKSKRWTAKNQIKTKAHKLAKQHRDEIMKPACEVCGDTEKLHMHHTDYSQPLVVQTLCIKHHEEAHHGVYI